jgi:hypothetical protein
VGFFLALALVFDITAGDAEMPMILGGAVDKEGGVPWKKWDAV